MTDYTGPTGTGTLLIRDQGYNVEFHVQAGNTQVWSNAPGHPWNGYVNGTEVSGTIDNYSNMMWKHVATYGVGYNQTVRFGVGYTGTQGLGNNTALYATITRATVPGTPYPVAIDTVEHQTFRYIFSGNGDGGSPIREWQIGYGYDPNSVQYTAGSSGTILVGTFTVGAYIYIWCRGRNDVGWSSWSTRWGVQLKRGLKLKVSGTYRDVIPYARVAGVWKAAEPFVRVAGVWKPSGQ